MREVIVCSKSDLRIALFLFGWGLFGGLGYMLMFWFWWVFFFWSCRSISGNAGRASFKDRKDFPVYKIHVHLWLEFFSSSRQTVQKIYELWIRKIVILLFLKVSQVYLFSENNRAHFSSSKVIKLSISMHSFFTALSFSFWQSLSIWHARLTLFLWKKVPAPNFPPQSHILQLLLKQTEKVNFSWKC